MRTDPKRAAEKRKKKRAKKKDNPERFCCTDIKNCLKPPVRWGLCGEHSLDFMDHLWAVKIKERAQACVLERAHQKYGYFACRGPLNACHAVRREYKHTRWDLRNGAPGCGGFNKWSEYKEVESQQVWTDYLGPTYQILRAQALRKDEIDWDAWRRYLGGGPHPYDG